MAPKLSQRASAAKQSAGKAATQSKKKKTSATTAPSELSGLSTRAKNKQTHPGLPDAPNPRRSTEEVAAERAQKKAEAAASAKQKHNDLIKLLNHERKEDSRVKVNAYYVNKPLC